MFKSLLSTCCCTLLLYVCVSGQEWANLQLDNGMSTPCALASDTNFDNELDNFLRIKGSNYSDMYVKLIKSNTDETIREVYIRAGTSYHIRNIPQEKYYVQIAYGKLPQANEKCEFKFAEGAGFEQPSHEFNYFNRLASQGLVLPCYELNLRRSESEEAQYVQTKNTSSGFN